MRVCVRVCGYLVGQPRAVCWPWQMAAVAPGQVVVVVVTVVVTVAAAAAAAVVVVVVVVVG